MTRDRGRNQMFRPWPWACPGASAPPGTAFEPTHSAAC